AGLINKVVPDADLEATTKEWAEKLASGATRAIGLSKQLLNRGVTLDLAAFLDEEASAQALTSTSDDFKEGVRAFMEKRKPRFIGA
ncbi:MAG: enoyl-CoA hydratase/isomerase family protein, partial [Burkholderiales bacterium]